MSRIRSLKPEFFRSRSLARCTRDARLTFAGLWTEADDAGRGIADARVLKGALWPLDDEIDHLAVESHLSELERSGHLTMYVVGEERYYEVTSWRRHQPPSARRGEGKYPPPDSIGINPDESCKNVQYQGSGVMDQGSGVMGSPGGELVLLDAFDAFWQIYPRKVAKPKAQSAFRSAIKGGTDQGEILGGLERWRLYWHAQRTSMEYIPHPTTWLNQQRWNDPVVAEHPSQGRVLGKNASAIEDRMRANGMLS